MFPHDTEVFAAAASLIRSRRLNTHTHTHTHTPATRPKISIVLCSRSFAAPPPAGRPPGRPAPSLSNRLRNSTPILAMKPAPAGKFEAAIVGGGGGRLRVWRAVKQSPRARRNFRPPESCPSVCFGPRKGRRPIRDAGQLIHVNSRLPLFLRVRSESCEPVTSSRRRRQLRAKTSSRLRTSRRSSQLTRIQIGRRRRPKPRKFSARAKPIDCTCYSGGRSF